MIVGLGNGFIRVRLGLGDIRVLTWSRLTSNSRVLRHSLHASAQ